MNIALAGTTGYLGKYIAQELNIRGITPNILTRRWDSKMSSSIQSNLVHKVDFNNPLTLNTKLLDIDIVISSLGITRQKDNLTYMDVDYKANSNLLKEAKKSGVKKFIYVSALNGHKLRDTKIFEAKEKFVDELKNSGLEYLIIRPNGFFSDMKDFLEMAKNGRVYLFGKGEQKLNPIEGSDLAKFIIDSMYECKNQELEVGGPKVYTHKEIAELAFKVLEKEVKITYIPDYFRKLLLKALPIFCNSKTYGPIEFFLSAMGIDMIAPKFGKHFLEDFYKNNIRNENEDYN
jgi:uncharacterized protein YbjT (DUF2867 family)